MIYRLQILFIFVVVQIFGFNVYLFDFQNEMIIDDIFFYFMLF